MGIMVYSLRNVYFLEAKNMKKVKTASARHCADDLMSFRVAALILIVAFLMPLPVMGQAISVRGQLVLDVGQQTWEAQLVFRPIVIYNGSSFIMWYSGEDGSSLGIDNIGVATSIDGVHWTRYSGNPVLRLGSSGTWDSCSVLDPWVISEGGGYKMWFVGQKCAQASLSSEAIGYATSPDGINWTKYTGGAHGNPILTPGASGSFDDEYVGLPVVISTASGYTMYYRGVSSSGDLTQTGTATSTDGIHWTKNGMVSIPKSQWDSAYNHISGIIKVGGTFVASYYGYSSGTGPSSYDQIGFANSTDGTTWTPYIGNPAVTYGAGQWDAGGVWYPFILPVGSNYYVYYTADNNLTGSSDHYGIGLAILPASQYALPEYSSLQFMTITATFTPILFMILRKRQSN
jgi:predicted GH43/DUF377 family glycosyl hydrolase